MVAAAAAAAADDDALVRHEFDGLVEPSVQVVVPP